MTLNAAWHVPATIRNTSADERATIAALFEVWTAKLPKNILRSAYFDGKNVLKPTGNIPREAMQRIEAVLDWPEKAVSALAERSVFEGFVAPGGDGNPFDLEPVLQDNRFDVELPQAISSAYKHSCSFITTALGDVQSGEPEVQVMARSAEWSAALWDERRRRVAAALTITDTDDSGQVTGFIAYLPDVILVATRSAAGVWSADRRPSPLGEVLVEPLTFDPQLGRPFGRSRISRTVRTITDHALSTIVRTEISADFYAAPRMAVLGAAQEAFAANKWQMAINRFMAISRDEEGEVPSVQQFPQMTMTPLTDLYRMYATQFSGATGVPVSNLGIVTENPPSAEALYADDRRLVATANRQNRVLGSALKRVGQKVVRLRDGESANTDELRNLSVAWSNPAFTSPVTSADALVKLVNVFPWMSESEVALEYAGFSQSEITRLLSDKSRYEARSFAASLRSLASGNAAQSTEQPQPAAPATPEPPQGS